MPIIAKADVRLAADGLSVRKPYPVSCGHFMPGSNFSHPFDSRRTLHVLRSLPSFEEALARLLYLVEYRRPCGVLLGLPGTGTSALMEVVRQELSTAASTPLPLDMQTVSASAIPWALSSGMGLSPLNGQSQDVLWRQIEDRLEGAATAGVSFIPVIDHLQHADFQAQLEIGRCCSLMARTENTLLLAGQPPLPHHLARITQVRCDLRIELPLWKPEETASFVTQMAEQVDGPRFADDAITIIQSCTEGRLRDVLQVCRLAWFTADVEGIDVIEAPLMQIVAGEIWRRPTHLSEPFFSIPSRVTSIAPSYSAVSQ